MYYIDMNPAQVREIVNEVLIPLDVAFLVFTALYIYDKWSLLRNWVATFTVLPRLLLATTVHILGLLLLRGWTTAMYWYVVHDQQGTSNQIERATEIPTVGLALSAIGMAWIIKILSPPQWKHWGWVVSFFLTILFVIYMQWSMSSMERGY